MTSGRRRRALGRGTVGLALGLLLGGCVFLGGCVYYPTVADVGGVRLLPERGRVVRNGDGALFFVDITSTGMFEDILLRLETPIAKRAQILSQSGEPLTRRNLPGTSPLRVHAAGDP